MPTDDRDRQLDRALARRLGDASPDAACPDAETLAAYYERTLSLEEMAVWKEHIASCSRCEEALELIEESEKALAEDPSEQEVEDDLVEKQAFAAPEAEAATLRASQLAPARAASLARGAAVPMPAKRGSRLNWRWVAPVGALAAAVIVWIGVRDIEVAHQAAKQNVQTAENREAPPLPAPRTRSPEAIPPAAPEAKVAPNSPSHARALAVPPVQKKEQAGGAMPPAPKATPSQQDGALEKEYHELVAPKPSETEPSAIMAEREMRKSRAAEAARAPMTPSGGAPGRQANEPAAADKLQPLPQATTATTQSVEVTAAPPAVNTGQSALNVMVRDSGDLLRLAAEDHRLIVAPGQKQVWRVGESGRISRSTDGGKTWKKQTSGVTADLTSGSATSDKVVWVAGKTGTLLLTADGGKHWKQIPTPIAGDLGGVHAVDQMRASIWDVPNRKSFETGDGGETWKPSANE